MNNFKNSKALAWDSIGDRFWSLGLPSGEARRLELNFYLGEKSESIAVLGASSNFIIEKAVGIWKKIIVVDFSSKLLKSVKSKFWENTELDCVQTDLTRELDKRLLGSTELIVADRLVNRFNLDEASRFFCNIYSMLKPGGNFKFTVRIGIYPIDQKLIELGKANGTVNKFWNELEKTIDFSQALSELTVAVDPMEGISKKDLVNWYYLRGKEKRFFPDDIEAILQALHLKWLPTKKELITLDGATVLFMNLQKIGNDDCV